MATQWPVGFQEDSAPEQRRDEKREAQQYIHTRAYDNWRAWSFVVRRIEHLLNEGSQHWSTILPAHPALKMSDAAVKVGAGTMFGIAYDVTPSDGCPNRASLAREEVFNQCPHMRDMCGTFPLPPPRRDTTCHEESRRGIRRPLLAVVQTNARHRI
jgi:hypothetical protein